MQSHPYQQKQTFQNLPKVRDVILVTGVTGSGKTTWVKKFTSLEERLLVYDVMSDFYVNYLDRAQLLEMHEQAPQKFRVGIFNPDDAELLCAVGFELGNCKLVLEEISTLYEVGARVKGPLRDVILLGRHRRVTLIAIAQRAVNIPITLRSQATRVITFRQHEPDDVKAFDGKFGQYSKYITRLPDFTCLDWDKGKVSMYRMSDYSQPELKDESEEPDTNEPGIEPDTDTADTNDTDVERV